MRSLAVLPGGTSKCLFAYKQAINMRAKGAGTWYLTYVSWWGGSTTNYFEMLAVFQEQTSTTLLRSLHVPYLVAVLCCVVQNSIISIRMYICKQEEDFIMRGIYPEIIASGTIIFSCASIKKSLTTWRKSQREVHWTCLPCSERETSFPFFRNHCPSILPVVEKAQQEPHCP